MNAECRVRNAECNLETKDWKLPRIFGRNPDMKLSLIVLAALTLGCASLLGQGKIDLQLSDSIHDILDRNVGQTLELRLRSGEKIGGKVEKLGAKLVHLSELSGAEFYDAVVAIDDVSAVVVRVKK